MIDISFAAWWIPLVLTAISFLFAVANDSPDSRYGIGKLGVVITYFLAAIASGTSWVVWWVLT